MPNRDYEARLKLYDSVAQLFISSGIDWDEKFSIMSTLVSWALANMCENDEQKMIMINDFVNELAVGSITGKFIIATS